MKIRLVGIIIGALVGILLGSGTGIVGSFGGVAGVYIFAALGAVIGFFASTDIWGLFRKLFRK